MDTHLMFYVDLLGVRAAIIEQDHYRLDALTNLLHEIATLRGSFQVQEQPIESGRQFILRPEISTFSDHIVISFELEELKKLGGNEYFSGIITAEKLISSLALESLRLGMLIRGGATLGHLHHKGGVVFGPAMVEAYELESSVATYPRVVVSPDLCSRVGGNFDLLLLTDFDGVRHLNYFRRFLTFSNQNDKLVASWQEDLRNQIEENILVLQKAKRWKEMAKWAWIRNTIETERKGVQPPSN